MQSEIDRFKGTVQLIHDYYHAIEEKVIPDQPDSFTTELTHDGDDLPEVEKMQDGADPTNVQSYLYPRLEELFKRALKAQVVQEPSSSNQTHKAPDPKAKGGKKPDPKKGGAGEHEEKVHESTNWKEMKAAIKVEKANLRFRLT
jgi:hypothetical protein